MQGRTDASTLALDDAMSDSVGNSVGDLASNTISDAITADARYFEYTSSANPIGAKLISRVPYRTFHASLYASGPTRAVPLDLSAELGCPGPATGPGLAAHFVRI